MVSLYPKPVRYWRNSLADAAQSIIDVPSSALRDVAACLPEGSIDKTANRTNPLPPYRIVAQTTAHCHPPAPAVEHYLLSLGLTKGLLPMGGQQIRARNSGYSRQTRYPYQPLINGLEIPPEPVEWKVAQLNGTYLQNKAFIYC